MNFVFILYTLRFTFHFFAGFLSVEASRPATTKAGPTRNIPIGFKQAASIGAAEKKG